MKTLIMLCIFALAIVLCRAELVVTPSAPKIIGNKAVVTLGFKNNFTVPIKSARAICFLLDEQGEMVGQSTKWVINKSQNNGLAAGATNTFNFVITSPQPFASTNLTAKIVFSRVILAGSKPVNPVKDVVVMTGH